MIEKAGTGILTLMLTACAGYTSIAPPSPSLCRAHGVDVPPNAQVTGQIVEFDYVRQDEVLRECGGVSQYGCAIRVGIDRYRIVVGDDPNHSIRTEEECHSLYQVARHTSTE